MAHFGVAPGFFRRHRAAVASWAALSVFAAGLAAYALQSRGYPVHKADLDDGGIWVTNQEWGTLGRQNRPVAQLDGVVWAGEQGSRSENAGLDVLQNGKAVVSVDRSARTLTPVDTQLSQGLGDDAVQVKDTRVVLGGDTVGLTEARTGRTWLTRVDPATGVTDLSALSATAKPLVTVGPDAVLTIGADGTAYVVSGAEHTLTTIAPTAGGFAKPATAALAPKPKGTPTQLTAVGHDPVTADAEGTIATRSATADLGKGLVLQQAGPAADDVLAATPTGFDAVDLASGKVSKIASARGEPSAPVRLQNCSFGAWASGSTGTVVSRCGDAAPQTGTITGLGPVPELVFRVNRGQLVLNDMRNGDVWEINGAQIRKISNWEAYEPRKPDNSQQHDKNTQATKATRKPKALDDDLGVRAGRTTVLHVLDNDSSAADSILSVVSVTQPSQSGVRAEIAPDRQSILVNAADTAADAQVRFDYTVDDGTGAGGGKGAGQDDATVRLSVHGDGGSGTPSLRDHYKPTPYTVAAGGSIELPVTTDWRDEQYGDPVSAQSPRTSAGEATVTPEGLIRYTAAQRTRGRQTVTYAATTGGRTVQGKVEVNVVSGADAASPKPQNDVAEGTQGSWITIRPLDNDIPGADPSNLDARLSLAGDVPPKGGLEVRTDRDTGVVRVRGRSPGTFTLPYSASFGAAKPAAARIRVDIAPRGNAPNAPIATPDTTAVLGTATRTVDVLANDYDAQGRMLVVTHAEPVRDDSPLQVAVIDGRWLRVSASDDAMTPKTQAISYTLSNGDAEAEGTLTVSQRPALRGSGDAPVTVTDEATVRAGDSVSVPVLDNDSTPSGDPVGLVVDETVTPAGQLQVLPQPAAGRSNGAAYVDGNRVRFVAPTTVDGPTDVDVRYLAQNTGDLSAERSSGTLHVHITPPPKTPADDQPPTPAALEGRVVQGDTLTIQLPTVGSDPDGDSVSITGIGSADGEGGTGAPRLGRILAYGANSITYQAFPQSTGTDEFTYEVTDTYGKSATGNVRVGVVPPGAPQKPVAVDDLVTLDPTRTLTYDVLANDLRTPGTRLSVEPLADPAKGVSVDEKTGVMTVRPGADVPFLHIPYRATTGLADDAGELAVRYQKGFDNPPQAGAVVAEPGADSARVTVDVKTKVSDIDDDLDDVKVDQVRGPTPDAIATVGRDGKVSLPVGDRTTVWTYRVTDPAGSQAVGTIYVPARPTGAPYLKPGSLIDIAPGATKTVDLADYVVDPEGDPVVLTTKDRISTAPGQQLTAGDTTATTIQLTAAGSPGPAALTFQVSDRKNLTAKDAHLATVTIPVQVGDDRPQLSCPSTPIEVPESGQSALIDVAAVCHVWTANPADAAKLRYTAEVGKGLAGVSVRPEGNDLRLEATRADAGAQGALTIHVAGSGATGRLLVKVVQLPPPTLEPVKPLQTEAGKPVSVDLASYLDSPVPGGSRDVVVTSVEPLGGAPAMGRANGSRINFATPSKGHGHYRYRVEVSDSGASSKRPRASGVVEVDVVDVPGTPTALVSTSDYLANVVALSWHAPADNGDDRIRSYEVQADGKTVQKCPATSCRISGLKNGHTYTFRVRAVNSIGPSRSWSNTAKGEPDDYTGKVRNLRVTRQRDHQVTLVWQPPAACDCSKVQHYRVTWPGGGIKQTAASQTTYVAHVDSNGDPVTFTVTPLNDKGMKTGQGPTATVVGTGAGKPDTPSRPSVDPVDRADNSGKAVTISWSPTAANGPGPVTYSVRRTGGGAAKAVCTWVSATSCQDTVSNDGTVYSYTVQARNGEATSPREQAAGGNPALHVSRWSPATSIEAAAQPDTVRIKSFKATGKDGTAQVTFDVGASHGKSNTVKCTVNGGSCGSWSYPTGGHNGVTKTLTGLPDGSTSTVHLVACNGSQGGAGAGSACGADASASTTTYGPIGTPKISASASGQKVNWSVSVDPNGKAAKVTVTRNGSTIYSATTGAGTFSHSATDSLSYSTKYTYKVIVSDSGRSSTSDSASATTSGPPAELTLSKGTQMNNADCVDPSCAYLHVNLKNFQGAQHCIPHSDAKGGKPFSTKTLSNGDHETSWFFGYQNAHIHVTCTDPDTNKSVDSNTLTW